jgi:hypothetical protein
MTEGTWFIITLTVILIGIIVTFWYNVRVLRRKLGRWRGDFTVAFIVIMGNVRASPGRIAVWTALGFSEAEARIIIRQQQICLLEIPIAAVVGCVVGTLLMR